MISFMATSLNGNLSKVCGRRQKIFSLAETGGVVYIPIFQERPFRHLWSDPSPHLSPTFTTVLDGNQENV
jgi:hypothetical protein